MKRFRHYVKRIFGIDMRPILADRTKGTDSKWKNKEKTRKDSKMMAGRTAVNEIVERDAASS